ncbi:MAG: hypothetical protein H7Z41_04030 [Cytophagales bacterium]|nr:hypothetical protein [Armatimonadota bacterium]
MNQQVYGIFDSIENAERALSALKDHGASGNEVSVVRRSDGTGIPQLEQAADHGVTVTGPADVVAGAAKGGAVGLALGVLAGAVALTIPGIGPILAAGPLAAALGAATAATAAGAIGGGVVGYFVDQGIPEEAAIQYSDHIGRGNILVAVRSPQLSAADAELVLQKYGAVHTSRHAVGTPTSVNEPPIVDTVAESNATIPARPTPPLRS